MTSQRFFLNIEQRTKFLTFLNDLTDEQLNKLVKKSTGRTSISRVQSIDEVTKILDESFTKDFGYAIQTFRHENLLASKRTIFAQTKISHKILPFYRLLGCVYQRFNLFEYDIDKNLHVFQDEFLLSCNVCNQLALSTYFCSETNSYRTKKLLILRFIRLDCPPMPNGRYDDDLPANLTIFINKRPVEKVSIRPGREINVTSLVMFNPMLKNRIEISWFDSRENDNSLAKYAVHLFLYERRTIDELRQLILNKMTKFDREDFRQTREKIVQLLCPIDQRRLKIPVRAITCDHFRCFDLDNFLVLNGKTNEWICPICHKTAAFEDLQIDVCTLAILEKFSDKNVIVDENFEF